jgi:putative Mn2+ efflux pump MntP
VLLLGLSISLDELAIGFSLGLLRLPAAPVIALIALQALIVTQLGLRLAAASANDCVKAQNASPGSRSQCSRLFWRAEKLLS